MNGMASWCWEAAHALAEAGEEVCLVCRPGVQLPDEPAVPIRWFEEAAEPLPVSMLAKAFDMIGGLSSRPQNFLQSLHDALIADGISPRVYLLNQSDLHSERVPVPQYVVAWANPPSLIGYMRSIPVTGGWRPSKRLIRAAIGCIGWYRKDWRGYRRATGVMAVSRQLADTIRRAGIDARVVHPGTAVRPTHMAVGNHPVDRPVRLLVAAADLDDDRKRIRLILDALRRSPPSRPVELTLVGQASEDIRASAVSLPFRTQFTGALKRSTAIALYADHDVFLFASAIDDWGYVLVEAMAAGLQLVVPDQSPFDEIVNGNVGRRFRPGSIDNLSRCIIEVVDQWTPTARNVAAECARTLFSRPIFAKHLLAAMGSAGRVSDD